MDEPISAVVPEPHDRLDEQWRESPRDPGVLIVQFSLSIAFPRGTESRKRYVRFYWSWSDEEDSQTHVGDRLEVVECGRLSEVII